MSAASPYPPLVLWGDLLGESAAARRGRALLPGLLARLPVVEARRFWPAPGAEPTDGRPLPLADGGPGRTVRTLASEGELAAVRRAVEATAPLGCPVLALAGPAEDPSDAIRADLPHCGEVLLVDPSFEGDGETLAESLRCHWQACLADEARDPVEVVMTAPVLGPSGYAADARALFLALEDEPGVRLALRPLRYGEAQSAEDPATLAKVLEAARREPGERPLYLQVLLPWQFAPQDGAAADILRTTYEGEGLPRQWRPIVAGADELWLPCGQNLRSFRAAGLRPE
ncbi:MAG: hypothetical protein R3F30_16230, partial [Planctomycetota bacterium]